MSYQLIVDLIVYRCLYIEGTPYMSWECIVLSLHRWIAGFI